MDNPLGSDSEQRMALVSKELERYSIHIAALSQTRLADHGQLQEVGVGDTFFWKGKKVDGNREAGVSFAIHRKLVPSLVEFLKCVNEHLMTLCLHLH